MILRKVQSCSDCESWEILSFMDSSYIVSQRKKNCQFCVWKTKQKTNKQTKNLPDNPLTVWTAFSLCHDLMCRDSWHFILKCQFVRSFWACQPKTEISKERVYRFDWNRRKSRKKYFLRNKHTEKNTQNLCG